MLPAKTARTRSVGTRFTEKVNGRLESLAAERGLAVGEWVLRIPRDADQRSELMSITITK
jgi:hypothetical protein